MDSVSDESSTLDTVLATLQSLTTEELETVRAEAGMLRMMLHEEQRKADSVHINERIREMIAAAADDEELSTLELASILSTGIGVDSILLRGEVLEIMVAAQGFTIRPLGVDMFAGRVCQLVYPDGEFGSSNVSVDPMSPDFSPYLPYIRLGQHLWRAGIKELVPSKASIVPMGMYPGEEAAYTPTTTETE